MSDEVEWNCSLATMLSLDFKNRTGRGVGMDDETFDLIAQMCTRIGMIMEDASIVALTVNAISREERMGAIADLEAASSQIRALAKAAKALAV